MLTTSPDNITILTACDVLRELDGTIPVTAHVTGSRRVLATTVDDWSENLIALAPVQAYAYHVQYLHYFKDSVSLTRMSDTNDFPVKLRLHMVSQVDQVSLTSPLSLSPLVCLTDP